MKTIHELLAEEQTLILPYQDIERLAAACNTLANKYKGLPGEATYNRIRDSIYTQFPSAIPVSYNAD